VVKPIDFEHFVKVSQAFKGLGSGSTKRRDFQARSRHRKA